MGKNLEIQKGQVGIRFPEYVINGEQLEELKQAYESNWNVGVESDRKEAEEFPEMTLWRQNKGKTIATYEEEQKSGQREIKESGTKNIQVKVIELWGDVEQIYPQRLMAGTVISKEDEAGCMLSDKAAFELFGAVDVLGKEVLYEGNTYEIRGILDLEEQVFLREDKQESCSFFEVQEDPGKGVEQLRQILSPAGISLEDGAVLEWDMICWILGMLRILTVGILLCVGIRWINQIMCSDNILAKWHPKKGTMCAVQYFLRMAVLLVLFLLLKENWCLSQDYIPAKWSDFEFFGELLREQRENYMRYLDLPDIQKDRELFKEMYWSLVWIGGSVVSGWVWIGRRDKYRTNV